MKKSSGWTSHLLEVSKLRVWETNQGNSDAVTGRTASVSTIYLSGLEQ